MKDGRKEGRKEGGTGDCVDGGWRVVRALMQLRTDHQGCSESGG